MSRWVYFSMAVSLVCMLSCGGNTKGAPAPDAATLENNGADLWSPITIEAMDALQQEQLNRANVAREELVDAIMEELGEALADGGSVGAIRICRKRAPEIASQVSSRHAVVIGRTSFKLRNPVNQPPEWARGFVQQMTEEVTYLKGPGETLGVLMPIRLQEPCLGCHGPSESIEPDLKATLDQLYPEDQATGFAEGDLRGWLWAEVAAAGPTF